MQTSVRCWRYIVCMCFIQLLFNTLITHRFISRFSILCVAEALAVAVGTGHTRSLYVFEIRFQFKSCTMHIWFKIWIDFFVVHFFHILSKQIQISEEINCVGISKNILTKRIPSFASNRLNWIWTVFARSFSADKIYLTSSGLGHFWTESAVIPKQVSSTHSVAVVGHIRNIPIYFSCKTQKKQRNAFRSSVFAF